MTTFQQNLLGRTVFGSGSYAPTRGPVSPKGAQGYLKRELRKPNNSGLFGGSSRWGRDGQSDTRSGVASAALNRGQSMANQGRWGGQEGLPGRPGNPIPRGGQGKGKGNGGGTTRPGVQPPTGTTPTPPSVPTVTVNSAGTLELPYSQDLSEDTLAGLADSNAALLALQQQQQQQALQYQADKRNEELGYVDTQRGTLNDNSARGVAFSSGYGVAVGRDAANHNNALNSIELANSQANTQFDFDRTAIINAFKDQLRQGVQGYGNDLADDAGTLGYGSVGSSAGGKKKKLNSGGGWGNWHPGQPWTPPSIPTGGGKKKKK